MVYDKINSIKNEKLRFITAMTLFYALPTVANALSVILAFLVLGFTMCGIMGI